MNNAITARIPKSPEPFRGRHRDMSEPRHSNTNNNRLQPSSNKPLDVATNKKKVPRENGHQNGINKVESILSQIKTLQDDEKHKIFLTLFHEMSFSAKSNLMANILEELKSVNGDQVRL